VATQEIETASASQAERFTGNATIEIDEQAQKNRKEECVYSLLCAGRPVKNNSGTGVATTLKCP
jgi:hypothetical protein